MTLYIEEKRIGTKICHINVFKGTIHTFCINVIIFLVHFNQSR